jgi:hypothetical protein
MTFALKIFCIWCYNITLWTVQALCGVLLNPCNRLRHIDTGALLRYAASRTS